MIKLISFPLSNKLNLEKYAEESFDKPVNIIKIEPVDTETNMLWAMVKAEPKTDQSFNQQIEPNEIKEQLKNPKTFNGNNIDNKKGGEQ